MANSIVKLSKSFFIKLLVGIIILPFVFWGMGDVFSSGSQNVLVKIDNEKISAKEFVDYLNRLNLDKKQRMDLSKGDLFEKILSDYIGKKIIALEIENFGIKLTDKSLKNIITNDSNFMEDNKFSRTKYEKFLLESNISAPLFEQNILEQEKKRQLLTYLSEGVNLPHFLIEEEFKKENQIKKIKFLELDEMYKNITIEENEIKEIYEKNKQFFSEKLKKIKYVELTPNIITGQDEFNESYFKKIDEIENEILDGKKLNEFVKELNLNLRTTEEINRLMKNKAGIVYKDINKALFSKMFNKNLNDLQIVNVDNKYFLSEIDSIQDITKTLIDKKVREVIIAQIKIKNIVENNTKIAKEIVEGKFDNNKLNSYALENKLQIKEATITGIKNNKIFKESVIKEIFRINDGELQLVTNSSLDKNYVVLAIQTQKNKFDENHKDYKKYSSLAKLNFANNIYSSYDQSMNEKYKVNINQKVVNRIKNTL